MKTIIYSILPLLAVFWSCQKIEDKTAIVDDGFTATVEAFDAETKTLLNSRQDYVEWTSNDRIAVFMGNKTPEAFELQQNSGSSATFRKADGTVSQEGEDFKANVAIYPYSDGLECVMENSIVKVKGVDFPSVQKYIPGSFSDGAFVMIAATRTKYEKILDFKNVCGMLCLNLIGSISVDQIEVKGNGERDFISGDNATVIYSEDLPSVEGLSEKSVRLKCDGVQLNRKTPTQFLISLPPKTLSQGFTVTIKGTNGESHNLETNKPQEIGRSKMLKMRERQLGFHEEIKFTLEEVELTSDAATIHIENDGSNLDTWYGFLTTNENIESEISQRLTDSLDVVRNDLKDETSVDVTLNELQPETDYYYVVFGLTSEGTRYGKSECLKFTTPSEGLTMVENSAWKVTCSVPDEQSQISVTVTSTDDNKYFICPVGKAIYESHGIKAVAEAELAELKEKLSAEDHGATIDQHLLQGDGSATVEISAGEWYALALGVDENGELSGYYAISDIIVINE